MIQYASGENNALPNETLAEIKKLNDMEYSYDIIVVGELAEFSFIIYNTTYAREELYIDSYYYSITFIGEERREERLSIVELPINETTYHGKLKMENLERKGNYLVCVFFLKNQTDLVGSSRFCYVVSIANTCNLYLREEQFGDRHVFVILAFATVLLLITVLFTCIRDYIYRPRTIEALLKTLPEHHATDLETLAPRADDRRRRRTQPALNKRLREDSVLTISYDHNPDDEYMNYHNTYENASLDMVPE